MSNNQKPRRKVIRLKEYDYSLPGYYFVTICTQDRQYLLGKIIDGTIILNQYGKIVDKIINQLPNRYQNIDLDVYQIMPNHIHMIIAINDHIANNVVGAGSSRPKIPLGQIVAWFKYQSTKQINHIIYGSGKTTNNGLENPTRNGREDPAPTNKKYPFKKIWQRNYYEHVIRNEEELNKTRQYIVDNPNTWPQDENNNNFRP